MSIAEAGVERKEVWARSESKRASLRVSKVLRFEWRCFGGKEERAVTVDKMLERGESVAATGIVVALPFSSATLLPWVFYSFFVQADTLTGSVRVGFSSFSDRLLLFFGSDCFLASLSILQIHRIFRWIATNMLSWKIVFVYNKLVITYLAFSFAFLL